MDNVFWPINNINHLFFDTNFYLKNQEEILAEYAAAYLRKHSVFALLFASQGEPKQEREAIIKTLITIGAKTANLPREGVVLRKNAQGRPALVGLGEKVDLPFISLTHRSNKGGGSQKGRGYHAFALAYQEVGIDIEFPPPMALLPWNILREDEVQKLKTTPEPQRASALALLWTQKEACLKAIGWGLLCAPERVIIQENKKKILVMGDPPRGEAEPPNPEPLFLGAMESGLFSIEADILALTLVVKMDKSRGEG